MFAGRVDDVFKVNDLSVNPIEVEEEIIKDITVDQVTVTGIANDQGILEVHAFIIPGADFELESFKLRVSQRLFSHQVPKHIHVVTSLPETMTNKQDRRTIKQTVKNATALQPV